MAINLDQIKLLHQQLNENKGGEFTNNFLQIPEGTKEKPFTLVRLLPSKDEDVPFFTRTSFHRFEKAGPEGRDLTFHCNKIHNEQCPLCDLYFSTWAHVRDIESDKSLQKKHPLAQFANYLRAKDRFYFNVLERGTDEIKILSCGIQLFNRIVETISDPDYGDITDVQTGFDFKIIKGSNGGYPSYTSSAPRPKSEPLASSKKRIEEILDSQHDISEMVKKHEYEELKQAAMNFNPLNTVERKAPTEAEDTKTENFDKRMESLDA